MQIVISDQAAKIRILAAELRDHAAHTELPDYQDKFARIAAELEDQAFAIEQLSWAVLAG